MNRKFPTKMVLSYAFAEALAFTIPVYFFIYRANYGDAWLLFLGVFLFMIGTIVHTLADSKRRGGFEPVQKLILSSHVITAAGIVLACLLCFLLLAAMVPGFVGSSGHTAKTLANAPPNTIGDKTGGLSIKIFLTATVGNFVASSFVGWLIPFYSTRRRAGDSGEIYPLQHRTPNQ